MDSLKDPFLFADNNHIIRYMNQPAKTYYSLGEKLIGRSLLDCHNRDSQLLILGIHQKMGEGLDEELITDNEHHRIYMRAVRDRSGNLLGYYERYEPPLRAGAQRLSRPSDRQDEGSPSVDK